MAERIKLSIIVPTYNEEKIIRDTLNKILKYLSNKKYTWELVVSDDGSIDDTASIVKKFKERRIRLKSYPQNQGKGAALKRGILSARGEYIIFMDADLSVPLKNIDLFLEILQKDAEVIIASRRVKGAKILIHQPIYREIMGRLFTFISRIVTNNNISDFTCGFKGFTREAALNIFSRSLIKRWAYDSEVLFLAKKLGYSIRQEPILWKNRRDTRVKLRKVIFQTFLDLLKIRFFNFFGRYDS